MDRRSPQLRRAAQGRLAGRLACHEPARVGLGGLGDPNLQLGEAQGNRDSGTYTRSVCSSGMPSMGPTLPSGTKIIPTRSVGAVGM